MIPPTETERLVVAAITAASLAQSGQPQVGYDWLQAGYLQALDSQREGRAWAEKLVQRWQLVIDAYCAEFDLTPTFADRHALPV